MNQQAPSIWMPALIGGGVFGLVGGLPVVGGLNCLCCSLVILAGFLAAFLYSKECKKVGFEFRGGGGAKIGVVAGLFYFVSHSIVGSILAFAMRDYNERQLADAIEQIRNAEGMDPQMAEQIVGWIEMIGSGFSPIGFGLVLVCGLIFGTIGGLIGGAVFKVEAAPPTPQQPAV